MKKPIQLTVNGNAVSAPTSSRACSSPTSCATHLLLTGTHLGCEHGVCGACTIELDGAPARSCIAYAVACDGADVRTIEGFDDDPVMAELREAFSAEHALQCGYCTPGMLVTARDIVLRLPDADEARIRKELVGQSLPLHGLRRHRAGDSKRAREARRRVGAGDGPFPHRSATFGLRRYRPALRTNGVPPHPNPLPPNGEREPKFHSPTGRR